MYTVLPTTIQQLYCTTIPVVNSTVVNAVAHDSGCEAVLRIPYSAGGLVPLSASSQGLAPS